MQLRGHTCHSRCGCPDTLALSFVSGCITEPGLPFRLPHSVGFLMNLAGLFPSQRSFYLFGIALVDSLLRALLRCALLLCCSQLLALLRCAALLCCSQLLAFLLCDGGGGILLLLQLALLLCACIGLMLQKLELLLCCSQLLALLLCCSQLLAFLLCGGGGGLLLLLQLAFLLCLSGLRALRLLFGLRGALLGRTGQHGLRGCINVRRLLLLLRNPLGSLLGGWPVLASIR